MTNDTKFEQEFAVLFDLFLFGEMNDEQERRFFEIHEMAPDLFKEAYRTLSVDFFLRQAVCMDSRSPEISGEYDAVSITDLPVQTTNSEFSVKLLAESSDGEDEKFESNFRSNSERISKKKTTTKFYWPAWISAMLFLLAFGIGVYFELARPVKTHIDSDDFHAVGRIVEMIDVEWEPGTETFKVGQEIEPGFLKLRRGLVELEFGSGVQAILEGPTDLLVKGRNNAFCPEGQLSVTVPPQAVGFEIATPLATVVDRGTAFSLRVSNEISDVHVVNGKVELLTSIKEKNLISEGFSAAIDLKGTIKTDSCHWETFFSKAKFQERLNNYLARRRKVWEPQLEFLASDSSLLYRLRPENTSFLARTEGRWHDNPALRFKNKSDRLPIEIDASDDVESLTLIASVCLENMKNHANTLLIGDQFGRSSGEFLWQINSFGMLQFHIDYGERQARPFDSPSVFRRKDYKTWVLISLVVDAKNRKIVHYFEGRPVAEIPWSNPLPLNLDKMTIGNECSSVGKRNTRFFNGIIEEFWIFSRPFSADEIERIYKSCR